MQPSPRLPLFALLSQTLVAFTIEFDNEFERRAPHRTSRHGATGKSAPWLVSMPLWLKLVRFVPDEGITIREFKRSAGLTTAELRIWLARISKWWRIVSVHKQDDAAPGDWIVRPTAGGRECIAVWRPLAGIIEARWEQRFGNETIATLRSSLRGTIRQFDRDFPDYLPILGFHLVTDDRCPAPGAPANQTLAGLLSQVLLAYAVEFERKSEQSLACSANILRLLTTSGVLVRDLPRLSGVSKEAVALAVDRIQRRAWGRLQRQGRLKLVVLTPEGGNAKRRYHEVLNAIEGRWADAFGEPLEHLRATLERLAGDGSPASPLFSGLNPSPENWRAAVPRPEVLPHYPMVLHRGGYPDGS